MENNLDRQIAKGSKIPFDNIVSALKHFSDQHKSWLCCYYLESLPYKEIGIVFGIPESVITRTLNRMIKKIKAH